MLHFVTMTEAEQELYDEIIQTTRYDEYRREVEACEKGMKFLEEAISDIDNLGMYTPNRDEDILTELRCTLSRWKKRNEAEAEAMREEEARAEAMFRLNKLRGA